MASVLRSALLVPVREAADAVDRWREQTRDDKPSIGVPAHIHADLPVRTCDAAQSADSGVAGTDPPWHRTVRV